MKEQSFTVISNNCVTKDNVFVNIDGVLYYRIIDPVKASYGCTDPIAYSNYLASALTRAEIGKMTLDKTFEERHKINFTVMTEIEKASHDWGIDITRYEIKDISLEETMK